jgi:MFS transporter, PAT family, beta-lactamase induction signal transducer AmpG
MNISRRLSPYFEVYRTPRTAIMIVLGFASGLPLALPRGTLQVWMATAGISLKTIGIFSLIGLPYTVKFLWSPFMDRYVPPLLGRRRGWMILVQFALLIGITGMAFSSPEHALIALAFLAFFVAFSSASQDIVIDAYRTDVLKRDERGAGTAIFVIGYRVGMLVSGGLALVLSDYLGWQSTYLIMAGLMVIGMAGAVFAPEPAVQAAPPRSMAEAVWGPLKDFFARPAALILFLTVVLYKLGDTYAGSLSQVFLIKIGFSATDVGAIYKSAGFIFSILGVTVGGTLMVRLRLFRSLVVFGILQMLSNLSFMSLAIAGKSYGGMVFAVAFENFSGGMGDAAFLAFLMSLCNKRFSATQYALLSSLAAVGRTFVGPSSGFIVDAIGWSSFFLFTALTAIPGLLLLFVVRKSITSANGSAAD